MMSVVNLPCLKRSQEASVINNFNLENNKLFFSFLVSLSLITEFLPFFPPLFIY